MKLGRLFSLFLFSLSITLVSMNVQAQEVYRARLSPMPTTPQTVTDITGEGVANPIASILSTAMLLRLSLGLESEAQAIENAIEAALAEGYRTPDIASDGGSVVTTSEMGEVIAGLV